MEHVVRSEGAQSEVTRVAEALEFAVEKLLATRRREGYWEGRLSSSALSTATALSALAVNRCGVELQLGASRTDDGLIAGGLAWLADSQCEDGGWGETPDSPSNLSTTLLVISALTLCRAPDDACLQKAKSYVQTKTNGNIAQTIAAHYGADRTFAVPILMNCALAGLVPWSEVPPLPFELAVVPARLYRLMKLQVVSYALPALIAVGLVIEKKRGSWNPLRKVVRSSVLRKLAQLQPSHGGFLDATPLTSFVAMSLAGLAPPRQEDGGPILRKALAFLRQSVRADGSWPIDTDLSVWLTSSATSALLHTPMGRSQNWLSTTTWLWHRQLAEVHPFTNAAPGGWPWTDKEGGVPDGDDTSGAILALFALEGPTESTMKGAQWLLDLQNADGGWPTFCRGWGKLPFDQSSPDITAHAIRALRVSAHPAVTEAVESGLRYLETSQREDGSWVPLWFGSQLTSDHSNPVFGTSRALMAYAGAESREPCEKGVRFLLNAQNPDGSWGADGGIQGTLEETSLAVSALCHCGTISTARPAIEEACRNGARRITEWIESGGLDEPSPIGLYFASLWYSEELYPAIWAVEALSRAVELGKHDREAPDA